MSLDQWVFGLIKKVGPAIVIGLLIVAAMSAGG